MSVIFIFSLTNILVQIKNWQELTIAQQQDTRTKNNQLKLHQGQGYIKKVKKNQIFFGLKFKILLKARHF